jgi:hypothetical protein
MGRFHGMNQTHDGIERFLNKLFVGQILRIPYGGGSYDYGASFEAHSRPHEWYEHAPDLVLNLR